MSQNHATSAEGAKVIQLLDELLNKAIKANTTSKPPTPSSVSSNVSRILTTPATRML